MITIVESMRAISRVLEVVFGHPPTTKDITEGFERPCSYLQLTKADAELAGDMLHEEQTFQIIRFGERTDMGYLQLLREETTLTMALTKPIPVSDHFFLYPENVESDIQRKDMALSVTFSVENFQAVKDDAAEAAALMEELMFSQT